VIRDEETRFLLHNNDLWLAFGNSEVKRAHIQGSDLTVGFEHVETEFRIFKKTSNLVFKYL